jgi:KaiC/GvpD/RAD55 family RecA-like ATPase
MATTEKLQELKIPPNTDPSQVKGFLIAKPANQWIEEAKLRPIPKMLFSQLWHESELCILFATTGLGKSVLAVQIADSISRGVWIPGFKNETIPQTVLYLDFELSDKQFEQRYSEDYRNHFLFNDNLIRIEINPNAEIPEKQSIEDYLINSIEQSIKETGAKILIVDNITYLKTDTEKAKEALPLMKKLKTLKQKYDLSILALAHTPKRDASKPLTKNDLSGSIMLMNFADSSFAIGANNSDSNARYLKQIKERFTEKMYGEDNVIVCRIEKPTNFLQFTFEGFGNEANYLKSMSVTEKENAEKIIHQRRSEGKSYREIGIEVNMSYSMVKRISDKKSKDKMDPF